MEPVLCMLATVADVRPAFPVWLTPPTAGLLLLFACAIHLSITTFKTWSQLSAFPGPALAAISYLPMLRIRRSGAAHLHYQALSQQHRGGLVRIGPHDLLSADPDHLRRMSSARSAYGRSSWYRATRLDPYHDMMGSTMDKAAHAALRAKMAAGYSGRDNPHLEAELDSQIAALVGLIRRHYVTCRAVIAVPVDFGRLADLYARESSPCPAVAVTISHMYQRPVFSNRTPQMMPDPSWLSANHWACWLATKMSIASLPRRGWPSV